MITSRYIWKVTFVGKSDAGKSSIIARLVFDSDAGNFMGKGLLKKKIGVTLGETKSHAELMINEVDGYPADVKSISGSAAVLIVVDVTKRFDQQEITKFLKGMNDKTEVALVANKIDRKYEAQTWVEELEPFAKKNNIGLYMVSSKSSDSVNGMMQKIANNLLVRVNGKQKTI